MLKEYLPVMSAIAVALLTFLGNYLIGRQKSTVDVKALSTNASDALRDDLLQIIDRYERREQFLIERIDKNNATNEGLQTTIATLRSEISGLRIENQALSAELQKVRKELELFERKVYYKSENKE